MGQIVELRSFTDDSNSDGAQVLGSILYQNGSPAPDLLGGDQSRRSLRGETRFVISPLSHLEHCFGFEKAGNADLWIYYEDAALNEIVRVHFTITTEIEIYVDGVSVATGPSPFSDGNIWNRYVWVEVEQGPAGAVRVFDGDTEIVAYTGAVPNSAPIERIRPFSEVDLGGDSRTADHIVVDPNVVGSSGRAMAPSVDLITFSAVDTAGSSGFAPAGGAADLTSAIQSTDGQTAQTTAIGSALVLAPPPSLDSAIAAFDGSALWLRIVTQRAGVDAGTQFEIQVETSGSTVTYGPFSTPSDGPAWVRMPQAGTGAPMTPALAVASTFRFVTVA